MGVATLSCIMLKLKDRAEGQAAQLKDRAEGQAAQLTILAERLK